MTTTDIAFIGFIIIEIGLFLLHCRLAYERPLLDLLCAVVMTGIFIGFIHLINSFNL